MSEHVPASITVTGFDGTGAAVNTSFPIEDIISAFHERIEKEWAKRSRRLTTTDQIALEGNFVRIDQGNRWLRYFLAFFAGHAVVEVEGHFNVAGRHLPDFHFVAKEGVGVLGGNSKQMTTMCAQRAASRIVKTLVATLRKHEG